MVTRGRDERDEGRDRTSWGPRILAPLAFFAAATVLIMLVNNSLNSETGGSTAPAEPRAQATTGAAETGQTRPGRRRRFYRIREGDTLEAIAAQFNTTVDDLNRLNPGVNANALTPGQRIRVR